MSTDVTIIADLGFGDAGKGTMTDFLASEVESSLVVRYSGGPQAAHNIITADGRHHTFAQFGSGSFHIGSRTFLSRFMLINPFNLDREALALQDKGVEQLWERLFIDNRAPVITPWHRAANRLRELSRGNGRHGSTGQGLGELMMVQRDQPDLVLTTGELTSHSATRLKLQRLREYKWSELEPQITGLAESEQKEAEIAIFNDPDLIDSCVAFYNEFACTAQIVDEGFLAAELAKDQRLIFEGSQGVLLDSWYGFHPHTTWSNTTPQNALELLEEAGYNGPLTKLGVSRTYMTRHGAGPFVTEDAGLLKRLPERHNGTGVYQGSFRVGYLDTVALRYAIAACGGIDELAITCLDRLGESDTWQMANTYLVGGELLSNLEVGSTADHNHQEKLTRICLKAQPMYETVDGSDVNGYLQAIEEELDVPITYASFGPTCTDKRRRKASAAVFA